MNLSEKALQENILEQYDVVCRTFGIQRGVLFRDFVKHREILKLLLMYLDEKGKNIVVLDIASGFAIPSRVLASLGYRNIFGTDSFLTAGKQTLLRSQEKLNMVEVRNIESQTLPFKDNSIDIVLFLATIEHLHNSPKKILTEIHRILKAGGTVLIDTPNILELRKRLMLLFGRSFAPDIRFVYNNEYNSGHHREYTLEELKNVVQWSGFKVVDARFLDCLSPLSISKRIPHQKRNADKSEIDQMTQFELGFHPLRMYDWFKPAFAFLMKIKPQLRDTLLVVGSKVA
jgi:ubiquinone/menaquinone biosynthesis C-methylase UbiE